MSEKSTVENEKVNLIIQGTYKKMRLNKNRSDTITEIVKMIEEVLKDAD